MTGVVTRSRRRARARAELSHNGESVPERVKRTEHEAARRSMRDWLRDRDDSNAIDFEGAADWSGRDIG